MDNLLLSTTTYQVQTHCIVLNALSLDDFLNQLKESSCFQAAFNALHSFYSIEQEFPNMSHFRLGPNMFKNIPLYIIVLLNNDIRNGNSQLVAHGITTSISWNELPSDLPAGWQGSVRRSYENSLKKSKNNTLVGLYVRVEKQFKRQGWSEQIINIMKKFANEQYYNSLIIPLRLPQRFNAQYAKMPYKKFIALRKEDGQYFDHWLRLHTRLGGIIIGTCLNSHQHAMNLDDFAEQFKTKKIKYSGYYLSEKQGLWYNVYIDTKRKFALINQECTWVYHNLKPCNLSNN